MTFFQLTLRTLIRCVIKSRAQIFSRQVRDGQVLDDGICRSMFSSIDLHICVVSRIVLMFLEYLPSIGSQYEKVLKSNYAIQFLFKHSFQFKISTS